MPLCADRDAATWLKAFFSETGGHRWCAAPAPWDGWRRDRGHSHLPAGSGRSIWSLSYRTHADAMPARCLTDCERFNPPHTRPRSHCRDRPLFLGRACARGTTVAVLRQTSSPFLTGGNGGRPWFFAYSCSAISLLSSSSSTNCRRAFSPSPHVSCYIRPMYMLVLL